MLKLPMYYIKQHGALVIYNLLEFIKTSQIALLILTLCHMLLLKTKSLWSIQIYHKVMPLSKDQGQLNIKNLCGNLLL